MRLIEPSDRPTDHRLFITDSRRATWITSHGAVTGATATGATATGATIDGPATSASASGSVGSSAAWA